MNIEVKQYSGYCGKIWVTPEMEAFAQKVDEAGLTHKITKADVDMVTPGYYCTVEACYGYYGAYSPGFVPKPFDKESEVLRFSVFVPRGKVQHQWLWEKLCESVGESKSKKELEELEELKKQNQGFDPKMMELLGKLKNKHGERGQRHCPWTVNMYAEYSPPKKTKFGWYKKPGFDEALKALKAMSPKMTERDLAEYGLDDCHKTHSSGDYNPDFVERREFEKGKPGCICTFEETEQKLLETGLDTVEISIINTNIEENTLALLEFLKLACDPRDIRRPFPPFSPAQ